MYYKNIEENYYFLFQFSFNLKEYIYIFHLIYGINNQMNKQKKNMFVRKRERMN